MQIEMGFIVHGNDKSPDKSVKITSPTVEEAIRAAKEIEEGLKAGE